ncbi:MAG TPA: TIGR00295 family protein [Nitrospirota bacterium]|nr:TIGR00295 family protein [Nitrospirota bacterium]
MIDEQVLLKAGCSPEVIAHCRTVSRTALSLAERISIPVDRELVRQGGLIHDIGRSRTHGIAHAIAGVEIAREFGLPQAVIDIIECHIGAGIPADEARMLGLPEKDYLPETPEQKIVSYADNLVSGIHEMTFSEALERFLKILGHGHPGVKRFRKQHEEIQIWMGLDGTSEQGGAR